MSRCCAIALCCTAFAGSASTGLSVAAASTGSPLAAEHVKTDPRGDASPHRVDPHAPGAVLPIIAGQGMPDIVSVSLAAWETPTPLTDPYAGQVSDSTAPDLLRVQLTFAGHINPPGPLGLSGLPYQPFRFGNSPVYGFVEIDVDADVNTGGETGAAAEARYLGVAGRFGGSVGPARRSRQAISGRDIDRNFDSPPFYERSGCDWMVAFCGCFDVVRQTEVLGDGDALFEQGEKWTVRGRFFRRAGGYQPGSIMTGGTAVGAYDPFVNMLFNSDPAGPGAADDRTILTLIYPLTMAGAAQLTGQPQQDIDTLVSNHTSIEEGLRDLITVAEAGSLTGPTSVLQTGWAGRTASAYLRPGLWRSDAAVATAYAAPGSSLYIWTDIGFDFIRGDLNGDGSAGQADQNIIRNFINVNDGAVSEDDDGALNGSVRLPGFASHFSFCDLDYDGLVNTADVHHPIYPIVVPILPGDVDQDGAVGLSDIALIIGSWGMPVADGTAGDANGDGVVDLADVAIVISNWGAAIPVDSVPVDPLPVD